MTIEQLRGVYPAITHMVNDGNLWYYSATDKKWYEQTNFIMPSERGTIEVYNIIEDEHFEARKAYALGKDMEFCSKECGVWTDITDPAWMSDCEYREVDTSKKAKPVYEWLWYDKSIAKNDGFTLGTRYFTKDEVTNPSFRKFKPSKRIRKGLYGKFK